MSITSEKTIREEECFLDEVVAMKCPNCGSENPDNAFYCGACATQMREVPTPMAYGNDPRKVAMARRAYAGPNQGMETENPDNAQLRNSARRDINWIPLIMVIASAYLISVAQYGIIGYGGAFSLEEKALLVLSFLASAFFVVTVASVVYRREDLGKVFLVIGMAFLILALATKVWIYIGSY